MTNQSLVQLLIVDDHPLVRDGIRAGLENMLHFKIVAEAGNADEALQQARSNTIDLALMDINLADTNGIELADRFHILHPKIAVLILSMHDRPEYVTQAIQAGVRGYVLKDAPIADLVSAINTVMSGGTYYSSTLSKRLPQSHNPLCVLTPREKQVLKCVAQGKSSKQIARELDLSVRTVETHRVNIKHKFSIEGQADLIRFAMEQERTY